MHAWQTGCSGSQCNCHATFFVNKLALASSNPRLHIVAVPHVATGARFGKMIYVYYIYIYIYVCMCIYIYIHTYTYVYIYIYACIYIYISLSIYVIYIVLYTYIYMCMYIIYICMLQYKTHKLSDYICMTSPL